MRLSKKTGDNHIPLVPYTQCHAKTTDSGEAGLSVAEHCRIVHAVAKWLSSRLPPHILANCPFDPALPAALHDVGKVSPGFQLKLSKQTTQGIEPELAELDISRFVTDHAAIGAAAVNRLFGKRTRLSSLATIVALHHGAIRHCRYTDSGGDFGGSTWVAEREKLINELIKECGGKPNSKDLATAHLHVLAGMLCVADCTQGRKGARQKRCQEPFSEAEKVPGAFFRGRTFVCVFGDRACPSGCSVFPVQGYQWLQVFHLVDHFFRCDLAKKSRHSANLLTGCVALVRHDDDAGMIEALSEVLTMRHPETYLGVSIRHTGYLR